MGPFSEQLALFSFIAGHVDVVVGRFDALQIKFAYDRIGFRVGSFESMIFGSLRI